eukprot:ANDGO_08053.mRNA.1 hypothetical protein
MVVKLSDLDEIVERYPFDRFEARFQHYVLFVRPEVAADLAAQGKLLDSKEESIEKGPMEGIVYWKVLKGMTVSSPFAKVLLKPAFRELNTSRNINTLCKLAGKMKAL